ncbi:MAG: amidohydrolase family protein [Prolixibacteraceae bacterium]|jgi:imidazolonepropionase-like amidohydrolase|nr:amidohydrolase family protein [Prolixibacteraceae bacterium]MBT6762984.1 amidohydrolase family protein [Prolixibacteraceae bacterium]MBT6997491.1 amidohydrolase family protein [Prolixibacteraceae bacterium]MBT7396171.1 amidohydrolase family protein [Prolixibacteraceae bacterium]
MNNLFKNIIIAILTLTLNVATAQVPSPSKKQEKGIVLIGGTAHLGTGEVIENSAIAFEEGVIKYVGKSSEIDTDYSGFEKIDVSGKQVYPGLILMASQVGLVEIGAVRATQDGSETGTLNPSVRSLIAYNTDSEVIPVLRSNGVALAQIRPGGGTISGSSSVVNFDAWNWEDAAVKTDEGIWMNWPQMYSYSGRGNNRKMEKSKTYNENVQKLKSLFAEAKVYKGEPVNLKLKALKGLFDGSQTFYITTNVSKAIIESISFAKKAGVQKVVLAGADEDALLLSQFLKENNVSVILAHVHRTPKRKDSFTRAPYELAAKFKEAGINAAITYSGGTGSMNLPFVAGHCVAFGLSKEEALQCVTLNPAKILGIENRAGSIEVGKNAHIVVSDGDLLDIRTNKVIYSFISGRQIILDNKHKRLYRKFSNKYGHEIIE